MTRELDIQLFKDFDFFHPETPITQSLMAFGFECGDGWYELIHKLCEDLQKMLPEDDDDENYSFRVIQVKEKFGGLRFYVSAATEEMYDRINKAEKDSYKICEECGQPGKVRYGGWVSTLCDYHAEKRGYKLEDSKES